jgi:hypothetical protein
MVVCLDSKDYVQIRNSLIILVKILPHFPVLAKLSQIIERKIEKVSSVVNSNYRSFGYYLSSCALFKMFWRLYSVSGDRD